MKVKNGEIFIAKSALDTIAKMEITGLPSGVSYKLGRLASRLNVRYRVIDDIKNGLVKKYGEDNGKGSFSISPTSPNWTTFVKEFDALMDIEEEFAFEKVKFPDIPAGIKPELFMTLETFVEVV